MWIKKSKKKERGEAENFNDRRRFVGQNLSFAASEAYKLLRTNMMFTLAGEKDCKILGVTSAMPGEGKSTTSLNLAYSLAEAGKRVLYIEADMRLPVLAKGIGIERSPGLSNVLAGLTEDAWKVIQPSGLLENLHVISSGDIPPNPSELLGSERLTDILKLYSSKYEFILFDLPPVNAVPDGLVLSKVLQGMIIVVRKDYGDRQSLEEVVRKLNFLEVKILGFVMTRGSDERKKYRKYKKYKKYYKKGYGYHYGYDYDYGYEHAPRKEQWKESKPQM